MDFASPLYIFSFPSRICYTIATLIAYGDGLLFHLLNCHILNGREHLWMRKSGQMSVAVSFE